MLKIIMGLAASALLEAKFFCRRTAVRFRHEFSFRLASAAIARLQNARFRALPRISK